MKSKGCPKKNVYKWMLGPVNPLILAKILKPLVPFVSFAINEQQISHLFYFTYIINTKFFVFQAWYQSLICQTSKLIMFFYISFIAWENSYFSEHYSILEYKFNPLWHNTVRNYKNCKKYLPKHIYLNFTKCNKKC